MVPSVAPASRMTAHSISIAPGRVVFAGPGRDEVGVDGFVAQRLVTVTVRPLSATVCHGLPRSATVCQLSDLDLVVDRVS